MRSELWRVISLALMGCANAPSTTDAGLSVDEDAGNPSRDAGPSQRLVTAACVQKGEPVYEPWSNNIPSVPLCENPKRISFPLVATLVDLSDHQAGDPGTCEPFAKNFKPLILEKITFPFLLRTPALSGVDQACVALCDVGSRPTAFGIALEMTGLHDAFRNGLLTVRVPAPWYFVVGDEHSPIPCISGQPSILEFGKPLACATVGAPYLGIATEDPQAPSVDILVDWVPWEAIRQVSPCCPYTCSL
ncbi:MAG: hypothetical protein K1X64_01285 [Myxococcaceae bacterium]|nr:hypothetical protein [Myxococcaceae bacterium]